MRSSPHVAPVCVVTISMLAVFLDVRDVRIVGEHLRVFLGHLRGEAFERICVHVLDAPGLRLRDLAIRLGRRLAEIVGAGRIFVEHHDVLIGDLLRLLMEFAVPLAAVLLSADRNQHEDRRAHRDQAHRTGIHLHPPLHGLPPASGVHTAACGAYHLGMRTNHACAGLSADELSRGWTTVERGWMSEVHLRASRFGGQPSRGLPTVARLRSLSVHASYVGEGWCGR